MMGSLSLVGLSQGIALLTYFFVGVVANGSVWLAEQVLIAFNRVIGTLQTAFNPQLIKQHSTGNHEEVSSLLSLSCKLTGFIVLIAAVPAFVDAPFVINLWLKQVPEHLVVLVRIVILYVIIDSLSGPFVTVAYAVGKLRNYQLIASLIMLLTLVLTYALYSLGFALVVAVSSRILCAVAMLMFRVLYVEKVTGLNSKIFFLNIFPRLFSVSVISFAISFYINTVLPVGFLGLLLLIGLNTIAVAILFFYLVLISSERKYLTSLIKKKLGRK